MLRFRGIIFVAMRVAQLIIQVIFRSVQESVIGVLSCLIECEDGNICEAKLDELCFEKRRSRDECR